MRQPALILIYFIFLSNIVNSQYHAAKITQLIQQISIESYQSHFDSLRTNEFCNRKVVTGNEQSKDHDACRDYIYGYFKRHLGQDNTYLHYFEKNQYSGLCNVIGFKQGKDTTSGIWVAGAHYDTNNNFEFTHGDKYAAGANDNGTGLAAVLELVRILSKIETKQSVLFAAWDFEESFTAGFPTGSNEWFKEFVTKDKAGQISQTGQSGKIYLGDINGNINFDMLGNPQTEEKGIPVLWACFAKYSQKEFASNYSETVMEFIPDIMVKPFGKLTFSDHYTFAYRNIPAVENLESDFLKDPFYHTASDNFENTENIDFNFAVNVTQGGLAFLLTRILKKHESEYFTVLENKLPFLFETASYYLLPNYPNGIAVSVYNQFGKKEFDSEQNKSNYFSPEIDGLYYFENRGTKEKDGMLFLSRKNASPPIFH